MDEADRILNMDFEVEVDKILRVIPRERRTLLFSATMTKKVQKLQRASLRNPVKVEVSTKYQTVEKLQQYYVFIPVKFKVIINNKYNSMIISRKIIVSMQNISIKIIFIILHLLNDFVWQDVYLVHILNELAGNSFMIFCGTCNNTVRTALLLRNLGFTAVPLHGQMSQNKRIAALTKFKAKNRSILISTDVASRLVAIQNILLNIEY